MSLLFVFSVNDPERLACALHPYRHALHVSEEKSRDGWGLGFYQGDEILLRRRPLAAAGNVDFYELARPLRTDVILGQISDVPVSAENTSPFRFRQWLGAHCGETPFFGEIKAELLASTPEFLRRNIRGTSASEHLFTLVLAFLHDSGKLDDPRLKPDSLADAIRAAVRFMDGAIEAREKQCAPSAVNLVLTNGRLIAAVGRGQPLRVVRRNGIADCPVCQQHHAAQGRGSRSSAHEHLRSVLLLSDREISSDVGGETLPDGTIVLVNRNMDVLMQPLT